MKKERPDNINKTKLAAREREDKLGTIASRRRAIAITSGLLAGLPGACEQARQGLTDMDRRCSLVLLRPGLLDANQLGLLDSIRQQASEWLEQLAACREVADLLAEHTTVKPIEQAGEVSLV